MRAIAASCLRTDPDTKTETLVELPAKIDIQVPGPFEFRYIVCLQGTPTTGFNSLHRAKNAIRRHFRVAGRKDMRWAEGNV